MAVAPHLLAKHPPLGLLPEQDASLAPLDPAEEAALPHFEPEPQPREFEPLVEPPSHVLLGLVVFSSQLPPVQQGQAQLGRGH
jgi:hypothetical protein